MSYRCEACNTIVPPGQPLSRVVVKKTTTARGGPPIVQIDKEVPVCKSCLRRVTDGETIEHIKKKSDQSRQTAPTERLSDEEDNIIFGG